MIQEIQKADPSRRDFLTTECGKPYVLDCMRSVSNMRLDGTTVFPSPSEVFTAYLETPLDEIHVVILWQDPYHGPWQAHGLSFSVPEWEAIPPSLKNIYKQMNQELWGKIPSSWDLTYLAKQWVFLLNSILTVTAHEPASHRELGREQFTDATIRHISQQQDAVVFLLWWSFARSKASLVDASKHLILQAPHPSPLSSWRWFFWCQHFSKANEWLREKGKEEIRRLP
jgi:uracil-DNA glycosylase